MSYDWMSKASLSSGRRFVDIAGLQDGNVLVLQEDPRPAERSEFAVFEANVLRLPSAEALDDVEELLAPGPSVAGLIKMALVPSHGPLRTGSRLVASVTWQGRKRHLAFRHIPPPTAHQTAP